MLRPPIHSRRPFDRRAEIVLVAALLVRSAAADGAAATAVVWRLDNVSEIAGHAVTVVGAPRIVHTEIGAAVEFNGRTDGLFIEHNPIAGLRKFTIEAVFQASSDGAEEQRFLHIQERDTANRALMELRMIDGEGWALDTYLRSGDAGLTLLDRRLTHRPAEWHVASLTYDGRTMVHYVDRRREVSGAMPFEPLAPGRTSIGVRQNRVAWFKGRIHSIRITADALAADQLLTLPEAPDVSLDASTRPGPPSVPTGGHSPPPAVVPLWPEGVPGAIAGSGDERLVDGRVYNVQIPTLTYVAPNATGPLTGAAVIVCPGGSYARLAIANEAAGVAERLKAAGVSAFILKYRLGEYGYPAPLQDVLRAVRLLRSRADDFGIRRDRIGVMGASAGGHVAASAATLFDAAEGLTGSPLDTISARPDFVALLYPVITMAPPFAHTDSRRHLLGEHPSPAVVDRMSLEKQVTHGTPPVFLVHTAEDATVPLENSLLFFEALRRASVPAEIHLFERGPHGFGVRADLGPTSAWVDRWLDWMRAHGWLEPSEKDRP